MSTYLCTLYFLCDAHEINRTPKPKIMNTILENIGNTPLVRINSISKKEGVQCELCTC